MAVITRILTDSMDPCDSGGEERGRHHQLQEELLFPMDSGRGLEGVAFDYQRDNSSRVMTDSHRSSMITNSKERTSDVNKVDCFYLRICSLGRI